MVEVRDATPDDAHAIATVHVRSWRAAYRGLLPDDVLAGLSVPDLEQLWLDRLAARPRAPAPSSQPSPAPSPASQQPDRHSALPTATSPPSAIYTLYLDPAVWRRGIGTQLHTAALDRLRSCGFTRAGLWVLDSNERALRFYDRHGWTDTGRTQVDRGPGGSELHERRLHRSLTD